MLSNHWFANNHSPSTYQRFALWCQISISIRAFCIIGCIDINSSSTSPVCTQCVFVTESMYVCSLRLLLLIDWLMCVLLRDECKIAISHASTVNTHQQKHKPAPVYTHCKAGLSTKRPSSVCCLLCSALLSSVITTAATALITQISVFSQSCDVPVTQLQNICSAIDANFPVTFIFYSRTDKKKKKKFPDKNPN